MERPIRQPLLLRIAPALLLAHALYSAAFLIMVVGAADGSSFGIGDTTIPPGPALTVLVLQTFVYLTLAWGFWQEHSWSRPVLVLEGPAFLLILLVFLPGSARLEVLMSLPQTAAFSLAFYGYLYWKPNVREYWASIGSRSSGRAAAYADS